MHTSFFHNKIIVTIIIIYCGMELPQLRQNQQRIFVSLHFAEDLQDSLGSKLEETIEVNIEIQIKPDLVYCHPGRWAHHKTCRGLKFNFLEVTDRKKKPSRILFAYSDVIGSCDNRTYIHI